jgi:hypothetical protein
MLAKPRSITLIGIIQILLAASFVIWLVFFPDKGVNFAWPITPNFSAIFIGVGFLARTFIGYFLWREKSWPRLRWQVMANYAFLVVIFLATYWHIDEMNWNANLLVAHIWVLAYTIEPIMLFLIEPRTPEAKAPLPDELRLGPILASFKPFLAFGLIACVTIGGLAFINPQFLDTRWPWPLDPFDARIMAAFFALAAGWCITVYFAHDWAEVRLAVLGLTIISASNFIAWLFMLPQFDLNRKNAYTYGLAYGFFTIVLLYFYWKHERVRT